MLGEAELWWIGRLHSGRFAFMCITIGCLIFYHFKVEIFGDSDYKRYLQIPLYVFSAFTLFFLAYYYKFDTITGRANQMYEIIAFVLILVMMIVIYNPFLLRSQQITSKVDETSMRKRLNALGLMCLGFILIFVCFTLDRLMLILLNWAYSIFYFLAWVFVLFAIITGYLGYLKR